MISLTKIIYLLSVKAVIGINVMKHHEYTRELLYHLTCGDCKNWWSYATFETNYELANKAMSCPHCGSRAKIQLKNKNKNLV